MKREWGMNVKEEEYLVYLYVLYIIIWVNDRVGYLIAPSCIHFWMKLENADKAYSVDCRVEYIQTYNIHICMYLTALNCVYIHILKIKDCWFVVALLGS